MAVAPPPNLPPVPPSPPSAASGDLYQRLQAEREARQAARNASTGPTDVATVGHSLLTSTFFIGLAVLGVLILTRKK